MGKFALVDLSSGEVDYFEPSPEEYAKWLGGAGFGARYLSRHLKPGVDPLGPENVVVVAAGPLTCTTAPTAGRFAAATKSPLTGAIHDSNSGGRFGVWMKRAGYDGFVVTGASDRPVYLEVTAERVEVVDASFAWGSDVPTATGAMVAKTRKRTGKHGPAAALCVGPAGENLVSFACVMNDAHRALGRGGVGAVFGSKRLKGAVVVAGSAKPHVARPAEFKTHVKTARDKVLQAPITGQGLPTFGTAALVNVIHEFGLLPLRNFTRGFDRRVDQISGEAIRERLFVRKEACWGCTIACGRVTRTSKRGGKGPEYESVWALGAACDAFDLEAVAEANYECNRLGLDTISTGVTLACAMELHERGLLDQHYEFGHGERLVDWVADVAHRRGSGDLLAGGSRALAEKCGAPEVAMQVKGLEIPAYDPRGAWGHALAYATSSRGACHLRGYMIGVEVLGVPKLVERFQISGKADLLKRLQDGSRVTDSLVTCKFAEYSLGFDHHARLLSAATGLDYSVDDLYLTGERVWNLERCFNLREGFGRADDSLPPRFLETPLAEGASAGRVVDLEALLDEYYEARGWDERGVPRRDTLAKLGLETEVRA
ncbi:MAG: aldehyde ferredoxin oxidoreductase family protein [Promethearchaeota archaeon]